MEPEPNEIELEPELAADLPDDLDVAVVEAIVADLDEIELDEFEDSLVAIIDDGLDAEFVEDVAVVLETLIDIDPNEELADEEIEALVETFEEVVEGLLGAPVAGLPEQLLHHEAAQERALGLLVLDVHAHVADLGVGGQTPPGGRQGSSVVARCGLAVPTEPFEPGGLELGAKGAPWRKWLESN